MLLLLTGSGARKSQEPSRLITAGELGSAGSGRLQYTAHALHETGCSQL